MRKNVILLIGFVMISFCGMAQIPTNQGHYLEDTNSAGELYRGHLIQWNRLSLGLWNDGNAFSIEDFSEFNTTNTYKNLFRVNLNGNVGIGTTNPDAKLSIYLPNGTASYPTASSSGDLFFKSRSSNSGMEFGNSIGFNDRKAWIIARHSDVASYGKYYSTLHLQPDVGDKSQYRGVSIGYDASTQLPVNTHLAVSGNVGIGTTSPSAELEVKSEVNNNAEIHLNSFTDGKPSILRFQDAGKSSWGFLSNYPTIGKFSLYNYNNNSNAIVLNTNGNVGIGTTNPSQKLHVQFTGEGGISAKSISNGTYGAANIIVDPATNFPGRFLFRENGENKAWIDHFGGKLNIRNSSNNPFLTVLMTNGNVGIGTTNPNSSLHIRNANGTGSLIVQGKQDATVGNSAEIILSTEHSTANNTSGTQAGRKAIIKAIANSGWGSNTRLGFFTSNNTNNYPVERMTVSNNGNVGIGTYTPDAKLAVNGNIHTQEVKVDLVGWPDYVFEEDYNLPTLQEVEQHISEKGHLKNIPSAAEVAQNGIQLGEMNKKLLEKIEQLTLYMIEQNKKTDFLLKEVETLKKKNTALEARLK
ncbi:hypothetical protein [Aquimarina sp. 433]